MINAEAYAARCRMANKNYRLPSGPANGLAPSDAPRHICRGGRKTSSFAIYSMSYRITGKIEHAPLDVFQSPSFLQEQRGHATTTAAVGRPRRDIPVDASRGVCTELLSMVSRKSSSKIVQGGGVLLLCYLLEMLGKAGKYLGARIGNVFVLLGRQSLNEN